MTSCSEQRVMVSFQDQRGLLRKTCRHRHHHHHHHHHRSGGDPFFGHVLMDFNIDRVSNCMWPSSLAIYESYEHLSHTTVRKNLNGWIMMDILRWKMVNCWHVKWCIMNITEYFSTSIELLNGNILGDSLLLFNIAMENGPFIDGLPGFTY